MKNKGYDKKLTEDQEKELFSRLELSYSRSRTDVWDAIKTVTSDKDLPVETKTAKVIPINWIPLSIAASFLILVSIGLFARLYTTTLRVEPGELSSYVLPDGSTVQLNAGSVISYAPYWWWLQRRMELEGEAFFEVTNGKSFSVQSKLGTTQVLGTEFNIYARGPEYQVYCLTGKVEVSDGLSNQVILEPGEFAKLEEKELKKQTKNFSEASILSWRSNKFIYNTTPLSKVFEDVERHYDTKINYQIDNIGQYHYTGLFNRSVTAEEALEIICHSFDLTFESDSDSTFVVLGN